MFLDRFLVAHETGLKEILGITLSGDKSRALGQLHADRRHFTAGERVHGGVIMALADVTASYGAVLNLPTGCGTTTLESKTNFLASGGAGLITAEATPLHLGRSTMVWQTFVHDAGGRNLAVVVQTQMVLRPQDEPARRD